VFHALGDVDELSSAVGVAAEFLDERHEPLVEQVRWLDGQAGQAFMPQVVGSTCS
jgi:cob(I)alamin adenosyltransferase